MSKWKQTSIGNFIDFNPTETLPKGLVSKKIPMAKLNEFTRKITGYEFVEYNSGPKFRNGDTLVAKITPCLENGKTAYVDVLDKEEVAFGSTEFIVLRGNQHSDSKFIYYLTRSPLFRDRAISCMEGTSGRKRVNEGALKRQEIFVPKSKSDQQKIASVLSALDDKIELNNLINTELKAMAKLIYEYWFVQFDFPFDFASTLLSTGAQGKLVDETSRPENIKPYKSAGGKMVWNKELKREIPEGWEVKKIKSITSLISRGISPKYLESGGVCVLNQKCIRNHKINFEFSRRHDSSIKNASSRLVQNLDILVNSTGVGTLGRVGIVKWLPEEKVTVDSHVTIVRSDEKIINPYFSGYSVIHKQNEIESFALGSTGQVELSKSQLDDVKLIIPPRMLQDSFEAINSNVLDKTSNNEQQNQELASLRDWLLPMLMNGQVTVADAEEMVEERLGMVAEPQVAYGKSVALNIPDNRKGFAKQVLAGKIVSEFRDDPNFTSIKFQKVQFLSEHLIEADLNLNYYYQAAGPYDNRFMHTIYNDFRKQKWFDCQNTRFIPLEKQEKIEGYYQGYFAPVQGQLDRLFELLYSMSEAEAEIVATVYAVWNNRIIGGRTVGENKLVGDFYLWSNRKNQYFKEQILAGYQWLIVHKMEPKGFGKLIKKARSKK